MTRIWKFAYLNFFFKVTGRKKLAKVENGWEENDKRRFEGKHMDWFVWMIIEIYEPPIFRAPHLPPLKGSFFKYKLYYFRRDLEYMYSFQANV